jgi:hypothetical protein
MSEMAREARIGNNPCVRRWLGGVFPTEYYAGPFLGSVDRSTASDVRDRFFVAATDELTNFVFTTWPKQLRSSSSSAT